MKRGISLISTIWKKRKTFETMIQKWIKNKFILIRFTLQVKSATKIKQYWKQVYKSKKFLSAAKTLARLLAPPFR
jgi:hypothetical protein